MFGVRSVLFGVRCEWANCTTVTRVCACCVGIADIVPRREKARRIRTGPLGKRRIAMLEHVHMGKSSLIEAAPSCG
jgi:hypothetical protein